MKWRSNQAEFKELFTPLLPSFNARQLDAVIGMYEYMYRVTVNAEKQSLRSGGYARSEFLFDRYRP